MAGATGVGGVLIPMSSAVQDGGCRAGRRAGHQWALAFRDQYGLRTPLIALASVALTPED